MWAQGYALLCDYPSQLNFLDSFSSFSSYNAFEDREKSESGEGNASRRIPTRPGSHFTFYLDAGFSSWMLPYKLGKHEELLANAHSNMGRRKGRVVQTHS